MLSSIHIPPNVYISCGPFAVVVVSNDDRASMRALLRDGSPWEDDPGVDMPIATGLVVAGEDRVVRGDCEETSDERARRRESWLCHSKVGTAEMLVSSEESQ